MSFARLNGGVLHWRSDGADAAPALVFSNSLGSDLRIWDAMVPLLADTYRVVRYDKRGHGLSDLPAAASMDGHVDDLLALLDHLGVARCALVGLSAGGMIAQLLALRAPQRLAALVLCCTAARIGTSESWAARIAAVQGTGLEPIADSVLERWFSPAFHGGRPDDLAGWRNMLVRTPAKGYAAVCAAVRDADFSAMLPRLSLPTLCVAGDADAATPPDLVRATAALIPGARFAVIAGAGHLPCIEQPAALAALVRAHLTEAGHV